VNQVQTFGFGILPVRVVELEGNLWFVASDVRKALGVQQSGTNFSYLSQDEVRPLPRGLASGRGMGTAQILSESGLYKFILRSDKPGAKTFQNWVTQVVLPAIRKDGAYVMGEEKVATGELSEDELVMRAMTIMSKKVERLTQERDQLASVSSAQAAHIERIQPAAQVGQALAKRKALGIVDFCRKLPGVSINAVQTRLYDMQYLHKKQGHWSPYAKFKGVLFDETFTNEGYSKVVVLEAGQRKLVDMYHAGLLPMLKGRTPQKSLEAWA
jgi:prophage antirepressor-like protein